MIDKIAFLYIKNNKILSTRSKGKEVFYIPGGKREGNESDLETLVREVKEELSVDILPETAKLYGVFEAQAHGISKGVIVRMKCYMANFVGEIKADNEIEEIVWLTTNDCEKISPVDKLIFKQLEQDKMII